MGPLASPMRQKDIFFVIMCQIFFPSCPPCSPWTDPALARALWGGVGVHGKYGDYGETAIYNTNGKALSFCLFCLNVSFVSFCLKFVSLQNRLLTTTFYARLTPLKWAPEPPM